jgi:acyl-CoA thioesterase-1
MPTSGRASKTFLRMTRISAFLNCLALAAGLTLGPVQSSDAARRDASGMRTILMLGDSLTDGYGLSRSQAFPALIEQKIRAAGLRYDVINAGLSGDTTAGGLRRLPRYLDRRIDVLVLELGINDAFRGVPLSEMRSNLQAIIDRTRAKNPNVQIVVAGMQLPLYGADDYVRAFGQMYVDLAEKNNAALIPYLLAGVGGDPSLNLSDRIHPNAAGQRVLAETVWRVLEPVLRKATTAPVATVT